MVITQDCVFLKDAAQAQTGETMALAAEGSLVLEVSGSAAAKELTVQGRVAQDGAWSGLAAINAEDFSVSSTITENGIYTVNIAGCGAVRIVLGSVSGGAVTVYGKAGV